MGPIFGLTAALTAIVMLDVAPVVGDYTATVHASFQSNLYDQNRLPGDAPGDTTSQQELVDHHVDMGDLRRAEGDPDGALRAYLAGITIAHRVVAADPDNTAWQRALSVIHNKIGAARVAQRDLGGALSAYRAGLAIAERLAAIDPHNLERLRDLAISHERNGDIRAALGDFPTALAAYQAGLVIAERVAAGAPDSVGFQRDLAVSYYGMALLADRAGQPDVADTSRRRALAVLDGMAARNMKLDPQAADVRAWLRDRLRPRATSQP